MKFAAGLAGALGVLAMILLAPSLANAEPPPLVAELTFVSLETVAGPDEQDRGDRAWNKLPMIKVTFSTGTDLSTIPQFEKRVVHVSVLNVQGNEGHTHDFGGHATLYDTAGRVVALDSGGTNPAASSVAHRYHFYIGLVPQGFGPMMGGLRDSIMNSGNYKNFEEPSFRIVPREHLEDGKPMGFRFFGMSGNSNFVGFPVEGFIAAVKAGSP